MAEAAEEEEVTAADKAEVGTIEAMKEEARAPGIGTPMSMPEILRENGSSASREEGWKAEVRASQTNSKFVLLNDY